jgi:hypothetical protein
MCNNSKTGKDTIMPSEQGKEITSQHGAFDVIMKIFIDENSVDTTK